MSSNETFSTVGNTWYNIQVPTALGADADLAKLFLDKERARAVDPAPAATRNRPTPNTTIVQDAIPPTTIKSILHLYDTSDTAHTPQEPHADTQSNFKKKVNPEGEKQ